MKVLVFGGAGFVGLNIAEAMLGAGHDVILFDRSPVPPAAAAAFSQLPGKWAAFEGDVTDVDAIGRAVAPGIDVIVLGAAMTADAARDARQPETILRVNMLSHVPILEAARRANVSRVINLSSGAAYGAAGDTVDELTEETPCDPQSLYAITKWTSERVGARLASLWNMDFVSVRLSGVYGPWERATGARDTLSPQYQVFSAAVKGEPALLARPGIRDWIYAPDVAGAVRAIATAQSLRHPLYNISTGKSFTVLDWGKRLTAHFPGFVCRLVESGEKPTVDLHAASDRAPMSIARLTDDLGWRAADGGIETADKLVAWWRRHGEGRVNAA